MRKSMKSSKRSSTNEWLVVLEGLQRLMKSRISEEEGIVAKDKRAFNKPLLGVLNAAYGRTLRYYVDLREGGRRLADIEADISLLWKETGKLLRHYDARLSSHLTQNGFWTDDSTWTTETVKKAWIYLNAIRVCTNIMERNRMEYLHWSLSVAANVAPAYSVL